MKIRKILLEEFIRSIINGYISIGALSLFYRSGILSLKTTYLIVGALMAISFVSLTIVRIRTGHLLMVQGALGYSIVAAAMYAFALAVVSVGVILGQAEILLPNGFWSVAALIVLPGLMAWLGYKSSEKHPPQN